VFDKDILDNLKGQEIKELIIDRKITLEELDTSALEKLLDYETDMLCLDMGDMELIRACAARLDELNGPAMTDEEFWSIIKKAEERMISGEKENTPVDAPVNAPARVVKKRIIWKKVWHSQYWLKRIVFLFLGIIVIIPGIAAILLLG